MEVVVPRTENLHIIGFDPLITPMQLKHIVPLTEAASEFISGARSQIIEILNHRDRRLIMIVGPCSIHDPAGTMNYARRLRALSERVSDQILIVMRAYFEKPRTSVGWKGLINDPYLDDSHDINEGLRRGRRILADIVDMGLPTACEMLDPITPHYLADLICWGAIGARTTESQTHREMSSGLSFPVGFKNGTDGSLEIAANAMRAAQTPHRFLGINEDGISCVVKTSGNRHVHLVMRGGEAGPNYAPAQIRAAEELLERLGLNRALMLDCSHANSGKDHRRQEAILEEIMRQIAAGNRALAGVMIESYLGEGNQPIPEDLTRLQYGISITDKCVDWPTTERMIMNAHQSLKA